MKITTSGAALCAALLATSLSIHAAQSPATPNPQSGANEEPERRVAAAGLSTQDRAFVEQAARGGMAEVQEAKLAQSKAERTAVKESATQLQADHEQANAKLAKIAEANGMAVPKDPPPERKAQQDKLKGLQGEQFDREYVAAQIANHEKTIALFESQGVRSQNPEIAQFAQQTLPTLKHHLQMMRELQDK